VSASYSTEYFAKFLHLIVQAMISSHFGSGNSGQNSGFSPFVDVLSELVNPDYV